MGLFGSLFTGVSALFGQSQNTAIISNNIANVNTTGFKRSEGAFQSLVTTESRLSAYSSGTVNVNRIQRVDQQGTIQQTSSATDASISGNGMFAVKRSTDDSQPFLYTRAGQFSEDATGLLRNAAGFVLFGWPLDSNGDLPSNQGDLISLEPVDVAFLGGLTRPTTTADVAINLNASESDVDLTTAATSPSNFSRGITVFDSLGAEQSVTFEFTKTYGPQGTAAGTLEELSATDDLVTDLGMVHGNQFSITVDGGVTRTYEIDDGTTATSGTADADVETVIEIVDDINANLVGATAFLDNDGQLVIQRDEWELGTEDIVLANVTGSPLSGIGLTAGTYTSDSLVTYDNGLPADTPPYSSNDFPAFQYTPGDSNYNNRGWWQVSLIHPDGSNITRGLINFNSDGSINAVPDSDGNIDIEIQNPIDWGNGSEGQSFAVDIERLTQFSGDYDVIFSDQNGAELGLRTGVEIGRDGVVSARFSNGASAALYKVPLITFSNVNGLNEVSGTAYNENELSGEENLREAGSGGAGFVSPSTLEASNVDLANEFARLIVSQRAFGAATRTINTVDQMTQDLLSLRG